jgi:hypothetical protein
VRHFVATGLIVSDAAQIGSAPLMLIATPVEKLHPRLLERIGPE